MRKKIVFLLILIIVGFSLRSTDTNDIIKAEDISKEDIKRALLEEQEYNQYYYDEEPENYENIDYGDNGIYESEVDGTGSAFVRSTININGDNLAYNYKITNIPSIIVNNTTYNPVIQKTFIGTNHLFYIQRIGTTLYLSRVSLPSSGNIINASGAVKMTLTNFGHSQVLEYFTYGGQSYFWIGCKASDEDYNWSTQLARVQFSAGTTVNYTACKRLSSISYANQTGTSIGTIRRVEAALSTNKAYLLIWARTYDIAADGTKSNYKTRFSIYDAEDVNAALSAYTGSNYLPCTNSAIKSACLNSFTYVPGDASIGALRYGSNQGIEINNSKQIYIASESRSGGVSQGKYIYKINSSGTVLSTVLFTGTKLGVGSQTEMEGLQIMSSLLFFTVKDYSVSGNIHYIYNINPTVFD